MNSWRATFLVAWREATERARSRAFIVSTVFTLLIVGAVIVILAVADQGPPRYTVGLAGATPPALERSIDTVATAADVIFTQTDYADPTAARADVASGVIDAAVVGDDAIVLKDPNTTIEAILTTALRQARLLERLDSLGVDPSALTDTGTIDVVTTEPPKPDGGTGIAVAAVILLFIVITTYGQWVLLGVVEEKANHVVEQVVSSTGVRSLLAGKVLGIGALGLVQLAILIVAALVAGSTFGLFALPSGTAATAAWSLVWFLLGFAFYAVLYATAASLVSRSEDAQAAIMPVALFGVAAYLVSLAVIVPDPGSTASRILSLLPPVAPIAFPARIAAGAASLWEICLALALTVAAVAGVIRLAARIYAGALLASGSRLKLRQAWKAAGELAGR